MTKRYTMLPVLMVIVIALLAMFAIFSGRSNDTGLVGDADYPFHICTFNDYCEGSTCTRDGASFIAYLEHADGRPRLELARVDPQASLSTVGNGLVFETEGGEISGTLTIYADRTLEFTGLSGEAGAPVEHFATGSCERLKTP